MFFRDVLMAAASRGGVAAAGPTLAWTSGTSAYDPTFSLSPIVEGDVVEIQIDDESGFGSLYDSDSNTIDAAEAASGSLTFSGISTLGYSTTYYARARINSGAWSNTVSKTMDAPTYEFNSTTGVNKNNKAVVSGTPKLTITGTSGWNDESMVRANIAAPSSTTQVDYTVGAMGTTLLIAFDDGTDDLNSGYTIPGSTNANAVCLRFENGYWDWAYNSVVGAVNGVIAVAPGDVIRLKAVKATGVVTAHKNGGAAFATITITPLATWYATAGAKDSDSSMTASFAGY